MKSRKSLYYSIFSVAIFCALAVVVGLLIFYLASPNIKETPKNLDVQMIEGDYFLITDINFNYQYQFVIEEKIDGEFVEVSTVLEEKNMTNLSKNKDIILTAGSVFRFKACYVSENGSTGSYSDFEEWTIKYSLDLENLNLSFSENILSWNSVLNATSYSLKILKPSGEEENISNLGVTQFDFSSYEKGEYGVFVTANGDENYLSSTSLIYYFTLS